MSANPSSPPRLFSFVGGADGPWRVESVQAVVGESLPGVAALTVSATAQAERQPAGAGWTLRGITSHERYVERSERLALSTHQAALGRPGATCAALIPIRKNAAWWSLSQDERRDIFEAQSEHIRIGLDYLPAVARRLHHCRDLGTPEPFDFLTWFEYAPGDAAAFEELVRRLRGSPEWAYVDREVDIRLVRA